jgi:hypothetical protein
MFSPSDAAASLWKSDDAAGASYFSYARQHNSLPHTPDIFVGLRGSPWFFAIFMVMGENDFK